MMRMMKTTMIQNTIKIVALVFLPIFLSGLYSFELFINLLLSALSSMLILLGSMRSYKNLVNRRVENYEASSDTDMIDKIDDPHDLYSEEIVENEQTQNLNMKEVVKEYKKNNKAQNFKNVKESTPALFSLLRVGSYAFLAMSFIGLKNNELLHVGYFLSGITFGIVAGFYTGKKAFSQT